MLYHTDYSSPHLTQQRIISSILNNPLHLQQIPSKYSPLTYIEFPSSSPQLTLTEPNAISLYLASGTKLGGNGFDQQVEIYEWLEYFNLEIQPLCQEIYGQIFGKIRRSLERYRYALDEYKRVMRVLDERLRMRTFFVGDSVTVVDVIFCCYFDKMFRLVITPDLRKKFVNFTRWFTYVRSIKPFVDCIGNMHLCEKAFELEFQDSQEEAKIQTQKPEEEKQVKQVKIKPKKQKKKQHIQSEQHHKKQKQHSTQKTQQPQKIPESGFSLDTFKRSFQNSQNKSHVIDELLSNFPQGWSIWKIYYLKDVTEGKIDYLTSNLAKGTLQRLEALRKYGFGSWNVYHSSETQQYQIRGVMLWKGTEIAQAWKQMPSYQFHQFERLNPGSEEARKIVKDYWLDGQVCEGLNLHDSFRLI